MLLAGVTSAALSGLRASESLLDTAATQTAVATIPTDAVTLSGTDDLLSAGMNQTLGELGFRANLKVLQTANELSDTVLQLLLPQPR